MKITIRCEYAILALLDLAEVYNEGIYKALDEISDENQIPPSFLVQIMMQLKKAGFVESRRGYGGGYRLQTSPRNIVLGDILEIMDGPLFPFRCTKKQQYTPLCIHEKTCVLRPIWQEIRQSVRHVVREITFEDLAQRRAGFYR
ncbi:Rrf2 family transcriptional regulator [bacterium]|nr:Rrf2 family transcriptional regulator [bacterium]